MVHSVLDSWAEKKAKSLLLLKVFFFFIMDRLFRMFEDICEALGEILPFRHQHFIETPAFHCQNNEEK